ncbi:MAG: pilus assembly protein [Bradyrhizobium sp.]|uniref:TadE/TadG family type IV pilus assembly protein n=1 Tax=Bradyrhizobium sp. TaxID=376 RepID=UPI001D8076D4|nr:pilus assembly protein TadG-related protein [Bradyrhizobium sp.]MBV9561390.1 pilus assembly protein [Bradyrhizobium sp.]
MLHFLVLGFLRNRDANVAVMFALMMVPTIYLLGMSLDYTKAQRMQAQLNAAADAAAIAAATPSMMAKSPTVAQAIAQSIFNATANNLAGLSGQPNVTITIGNSGLVRTVVVSYTARSTNNFPALLRAPAWPIRGSATASASGAPNINFYLLADDSPSMAIAATPGDIQALVNATSRQGGCGFACHETHPSSDNLGNPNGEDNYALARNLNVTLRIDLVAQAVAGLMSKAQTTQQQNNNTYKVAIYSFDYGLNTIYAPSGQPSTDLSAAGTAAAGNIQLLQVYSNNYLTSSNNNNDTDTNIEGALSAVDTIMPAPGGGTNQTGDTPQEVVFLVTDGVDDMFVSGASACIGNGLKVGSQYRCHAPIDPTICTKIKDRGIRIAVLYTEYLQLPTDSWYNTYVASLNNPDPASGKIAQGLQACASPNLFYDVQSGGDITAALQALFDKVVRTAAHLTQ